MKEGDVLLAALRQADGQAKDRPVLFLKRMPPFNDFLVCGVSTQIQQMVEGFDELITPEDGDFRTSGLKAASVVRMGYLAVLPRSEFKGRIGSISRARLNRLADGTGRLSTTAGLTRTRPACARDPLERTYWTDSDCQSG